jgi:predicted nucleic acid-binding protein
MPAVERFFDTNVLLYLLWADAARAGRAEDELAGGGAVSVQVLNEFAAVSPRASSACRSARFATCWR